MDFIERLFHVSPDGGSGVTESLYIGVFVLIALSIIFRRPLSRFVTSAKARILAHRTSEK